MRKINKPLPMRLAAIVSVVLLMASIDLMTCIDAGAQDRNQGRSMVISRNGIVAAESPLAAQAGVQMLERAATPWMRPSRRMR
jgi:hypothetical protein